MPAEVLPESSPLPLLLFVKTYRHKRQSAARTGVHTQKDGQGCALFCTLRVSDLPPAKDLLILRFLRLGYRYGRDILNRLTDETVHTLTVAVRHLEREAHHYKGFVRFSETKGALTAQIEPKNIVLPLIARHFCERYAQERFLIHDKTHGWRCSTKTQIGRSHRLRTLSFPS